MISGQDVANVRAFVPVLDLSSQDDKDLAPRLDRALRTSGFAAVTGHAIDSELSSELSLQLSRFFGLPRGVKEQYAPGRVGDFGWIDKPKVGRNGRPDLCEVYAAEPWGEPDPPVDGMSSAAQRMTLGVNKWPLEVPELRQVWFDYYEAAERTVDTLLRLAAVAIEEPEDTFLRHHRNPLSPMTANWYSAQNSIDAGRVQKGAHNDWGSLTLLWHDGTPGLQIQSDGLKWIPLNLPNGCLVVKVGDVMARWTNNRWRPTPHRFVSSTRDSVDHDRLSVAWYGLPDYDTLIEVLPSCRSSGDSEDYPPVLCGDLYSNRMREAYSM